VVVVVVVVVFTGFEFFSFQPLNLRFPASSFKLKKGRLKLYSL
jgi:hypothetical protein